MRYDPISRRLVEYMPAPVAPAAEGAAPPAQASVPFIVGSNKYYEAPFFTDTITLGANSQEFVHNITPGGFLNGVILQITSAGGTLGTGVLHPDAPFSIISSITIEDISGGPILYPMSGFTAAMVQKYLRPWEGAVDKRPDFSNTINPAFTLRQMIELRDTLATVANTDARAQYRIRYTIAPLTAAAGSQFGLLSTLGTATAPTVTINGYFDTHAQPDLADLLGNPIEQIPPGLAASRYLMHEVPVLNAGANVIRHTLVGNEIRAILWIVRNSLSARINLTDANAGPIDFRLDNRRLWKMRPSQIVEEMTKFYDDLQNGTQTRETGVYVHPRFRNVGAQKGMHWLQTVEQTLLQAELNGTDLGANAPGALELVYDELAIAGQLDAGLEGL